ncbi:cytochrome c oxidase assembly protein [Nocardioides sp. BP30]|uniref:cytochrome c oxidase assembly protein n=1 Tax=Nocardioides sp. BP30 TaxID=3036374 RepID=UPI002468EF6F|nr:cytochrome c oxidase assembly protein [Nocardioides sp. BP30]WGL51053.1 cytochrome c oxidase assembly protein [Nocardioides sp. BP30]
MGTDLSPLSWSSFFGTWRLQAGWLEAAVLLIGAYLLARRAAGADSTVRPWRVGCWVAGVALMWVAVASAVGTYAMSVFWMHMVLHLVLIMVVPALLVLGHPLTVLLEAFHGPARERVQRILHSWPVTVLSHPATGVLVYTATIIGTHLTGFMDTMAQHSWLMSGEQVLYIVAGYLFLLPLLGEEPTRPNPPYLVRIGLLVAAMIPDTIVGIVLLQTDTVPFPEMMRRHPAWAPQPLSDVHAAGGLMWAAGDGLMMLVAVGLMISVITSADRRGKMTGSWLEGARRSALAEHTGEDVEAISDPDGEEALAAYNRMLARLREQG